MGFVEFCADPAATSCPGAFCTACTRPTWDYDCNGTADPIPAMGAGPAGAGCSGVFSGCSANDGYYYSGTPACGSSVGVTSCGIVSTPIPGHCTGGASTAPLPCR
jgi:hypothetical protein